MRIVPEYLGAGLIIFGIILFTLIMYFKPVRFKEGRLFIKDERLYLHFVRWVTIGRGVSRRDWWQEVVPLPEGGFQYKGRQFKDTISHVTRLPEGRPWSWPYVPASAADIERLRRGGEGKSSTSAVAPSSDDMPLLNLAAQQ